MKPSTAFRRFAAATALLLAASVLAACGSAVSTDAAETSSNAGAYPVTVSNCGQPVTFDKAPTRAVTNDINTFEDMAALDLAPKMAGRFHTERSEIPAQYHDALKAVPQISPDSLTLEPLIGTDPDFLFAGWNYGLKSGSTLTPENLSKYHIKTLVLNESCAHVDPNKRGASIDDTYQDLTNLGAIFGVQDRARALVDGMKAQVTSVQTALAGTAPKKVFVYDSGEPAPTTAPGLAMPDNLITLAGGTNVFHALQRTWTKVSWEQVVNSDPDCIVINDYDTPTYDAKKAFLQTGAATKDLRAVKAGCFIRLTYDQLTPSPLNGDAVVVLAKALHPEKVS